MNLPDGPLLQIALDVLETEQAIEIAAEVYPNFDVVEIGTPLIIEEGLAAVERVKEQYPDRLCLADLKIMDAGRLEASSGFRRSADIVTVLAAADDATILGAIEAAEESDGMLMADLINCPDLSGRAKELEQLGVPLLCVHTAYDIQGEGSNPLDDLEAVREAVSCKLAVAGGLTLGMVGDAVSFGADIVVVGGGILNDPSPAEAASAILERLRN